MPMETNLTAFGCQMERHTPWETRDTAVTQGSFLSECAGQWATGVAGGQGAGRRAHADPKEFRADQFFSLIEICQGRCAFGGGRSIRAQVATEQRNMLRVARLRGWRPESTEARSFGRRRSAGRTEPRPTTGRTRDIIAVGRE